MKTWPCATCEKAWEGRAMLCANCKAPVCGECWETYLYQAEKGELVSCSSTCREVVVIVDELKWTGIRCDICASQIRSTTVARMIGIQTGQNWCSPICRNKALEDENDARRRL